MTVNTDKTPPEQESPQRSLALGVAVVAGILAAVLRIVPHPPNFSGIGALGLFGGARLRAWQAYCLPLGIMVLSDLSLWLLTGFDPKYSLGHLSRVYVYASFMIYVLIGRWLSEKTTILSIAIAGTLGGLQFFLVTNFCEWLFQPFMAVPDEFRYARDLGGLGTCFAAALPFYQNDPSGVAHPFMLFSDFRLSLVWTILGDVLFTTIYMLIHVKLVQRAARTEATPMPATNA
jgi:hypothetical protein